MGAYNEATQQNPPPSLHALTMLSFSAAPLAQILLRCRGVAAPCQLHTTFGLLKQLFVETMEA